MFHTIDNIDEICFFHFSKFYFIILKFSLFCCFVEKKNNIFFFVYVISPIVSVSKNKL
jgi:hypothetical protein